MLLMSISPLVLAACGGGSSSRASYDDHDDLNDLSDSSDILHDEKRNDMR